MGKATTLEFKQRTANNDQVSAVDLAMQVFCIRRRRGRAGQGVLEKARVGLMKQVVRTRHPVDRQLTMETRAAVHSKSSAISDFPAAIGRVVKEVMN